MTLEQLAELAQNSVGPHEKADTVTYCSFLVPSQLFGCDVRVLMFLDLPISQGVSERQLTLVYDFAQMREGLDDVKCALFEHWHNNSDYWCDEIKVEGPEHAYRISQLDNVTVMNIRHWWKPDECQLRFSVPWDREHGAGVFISKGRVTGFGDL